MESCLQVCETCVGCRLQEVECISLDCPLTYRRVLASRDLHAADQLRTLIDDFWEVTGLHLWFPDVPFVDQSLSLCCVANATKWRKIS